MVFGKSKRRITRLLLVEDEPLVAFDAEHLLRDEKYEIVATVDSVAEAVAIIAEGAAIDLVLADIRLADGEGTEVARVAGQAGIPVLFVTGAFPPEAQALAHGHLAKPYSPRSLLQAIAALDAVLGGRAPRRLPSGFTLFREPALPEE